jgi:glucosyl-dolichyl phosphate glucuronosyltransferase
MKITVIIPTFNRETLLTRTLLSICKQDTKLEYEVIVIDNGSKDGTRSICDQFNARLKNFVYQYDSNHGLLTGRHKGIEISRGEILCFLGDDVDLNPFYLQSVHELFAKYDHIKLATGPCLPYFEVDPPHWLRYFWERSAEGKYCSWLSLLDFGKEERVIDPNFVSGLNFCIRKATVLELGGFHPDSMPKIIQHYQGDGETGLTRKAVKSNCSALYAPGLALHHYVSEDRLTLSYFKKMAYYEGVSKSFSNLRSEFSTSKKTDVSYINKVKSFLWPYYYILTNVSAVIKRSIEPKEIKKMKAELYHDESEGYAFHQQHFYENEEVKNWVLKENYWNVEIHALDMTSR